MQVNIVARRGYIKELFLNDRSVPVTLEIDPELCTLLRLAPEFMLSPNDKLRIVTRAPRGTKISAFLKYSYPS